jgi:hypothetical protein
VRVQGVLLKRLADEAYQPKQYERQLSKDEAARRIDALKKDIELTTCSKNPSPFRSLAGLSKLNRRNSRQ